MIGVIKRCPLIILLIYYYFFESYMGEMGKMSKLLQISWSILNHFSFFIILKAVPKMQFWIERFKYFILCGWRELFFEFYGTFFLNNPLASVFKQYPKQLCAAPASRAHLHRAGFGFCTVVRCGQLGRGALPDGKITKRAALLVSGWFLLQDLVPCMAARCRVW